MLMRRASTPRFEEFGIAELSDLLANAGDYVQIRGRHRVAVGVGVSARRDEWRGNPHTRKGGRGRLAPQCAFASPWIQPIDPQARWRHDGDEDLTIVRPASRAVTRLCSTNRSRRAALERDEHRPGRTGRGDPPFIR